MKPIYRFYHLLFWLPLCLVLTSFSSCRNRHGTAGKVQIITVFHAGSLAGPLKKIAKEFESQNPNVRVELEAAGSVACVRKITDLNRNCDVLALADYSLIDRLLIPDHAQWSLQFATNKLCLVYGKSSLYSDEVSENNWFEIIRREDVRYGRSDPDSDPCGYRTIMVLKLADMYYPGDVDYEGILLKDQRYIRPKASDLLTLIETNTVDYVFEYTSVAVQHELPFLDLPDSINLGNPACSEFYSKVSVDIAGDEPGSTMNIQGQAIIYGLTVPSNSVNPKLAHEFVSFIIDQNKGLGILKSMGHEPIKVSLSPGSLKDPEL